MTEMGRKNGHIAFVLPAVKLPDLRFSLGRAKLHPLQP